jgi:two-component system cell cycle response regulator DivK
MPQRPRILVVDDFPDGREMVSEYLAFRGFDVFEAANGKEAIEATLRVKPAVVLMDLAMPVVDGWEATRRLKADPATKNIPVIVISAHALDGAEASAQKAGCDAYIRKPNDMSVLGDMLWQIVRTGAVAAKPAKSGIASRKRSRIGKTS